MSSIDFVRHVPAEVTLFIFFKLEAKDLLICNLVSKYWQWIANSDDCWRSHVADLVEGSLHSAVGYERVDIASFAKNFHQWPLLIITRGYLATDDFEGTDFFQNLSASSKELPSSF